MVMAGRFRGGAWRDPARQRWIASAQVPAWKAMAPEAKARQA
jgi:hypothetical protein